GIFCVFLVGSVNASITSAPREGAFTRRAVFRTIRQPVENAHEESCRPAPSNTWTAAEEAPGMANIGSPSKTRNCGVEVALCNFQTNQGWGPNTSLWAAEFVFCLP